MNLHTLFSQIHSSFKAKHKQQPKRHRVKNRKVAEKPKRTGEGDGHHGRGSHHGLAVAATTGTVVVTTVEPWWPLAVTASSARYDAFFVTLP